MSTENIYRAVIRSARKHVKPAGGGRVLTWLDIGAGEGDLVRLVAHAFPADIKACDYHIDRFSAPAVPIARVDLDHDRLPYADGEFDVVSCSEVVEHLENYRGLLREIFRVLAPGGVAILTTPNVLNMQSRVRFFSAGFFNLFGPLPVRHDERYSTGAHITPIPYFYLGHALMDAEFTTIFFDIDKWQRHSVFWFITLSPLLILGWLKFLWQEHVTFRTITRTNRPLVYEHVSAKALMGRTIVVSAIKG